MDDFEKTFAFLLKELLSSNDILPKHKDDENTLMGGFCITDKSIIAIENNRKFFQNIPLDNLKDEMIKLLYSINFYEDQNRILKKAMEFYLKRETDYRKYKPSTSIKRDLKKLKKYDLLIREIFLLENYHPKDKVYFPKKLGKKLIDLNTELIKDLEERSFKHVSEAHYYSLPSSKTQIQEVLIEIKEKYSLKNISLYHKGLLDELPTYQYTDKELEDYISKYFNIQHLE